MKAKFVRGALFGFLAFESKWAYGQVILSDIIQYIVVFEPAFEKDVDPTCVLQSNILLAGWTSDSKFYCGDWEVVGVFPPVEIVFPQYKVEISGDWWVTDVNGKVIRPADCKEQRHLAFNNSQSPVAFEKAFRAYHGHHPWEPRFDGLRA